MKRILTMVLWSVVVVGCVTLLVAAIRRQNHALCKGIRISITGSGRWMMDSVELRNILTDQHTRVIVGTPAEDISTRRLEKKIETSPWVKKAELFFDSKQVLWVRVTEREPVARLFTTDGLSFYVDTSGARLPLKDYFPVKLPVFTSCPLDRKVWTGADTLLAREVGALSLYLVAHPFWMAMVQQVDVRPDSGFDLVPTIGSAVVRLGDTSALDSKFGRLMVFYKDVLPRVGWDKYAALDVRFAHQVIGVKRDSGVAPVDTATAAALLRAMIDQGRTAMHDTLLRTTAAPRDVTPNIDSTLDLVPSEGGGAISLPGYMPKPLKPLKPVKPAKPKGKPKPRAVMPPKKKKNK